MLCDAVLAQQHKCLHRSIHRDQGGRSRGNKVENTKRPAMVTANDILLCEQGGSHPTVNGLAIQVSQASYEYKRRYWDLTETRVQKGGEAV